MTKGRSVSDPEQTLKNCYKLQTKHIQDLMLFAIVCKRKINSLTRNPPAVAFP